MGAKKRDMTRITCFMNTWASGFIPRASNEPSASENASLTSDTGSSRAY